MTTQPIEPEVLEEAWKVYLDQDREDYTRVAFEAATREPRHYDIDVARCISIARRHLSELRDAWATGIESAEKFIGVCNPDIGVWANFVLADPKGSLHPSDTYAPEDAVSEAIAWMQTELEKMAAELRGKR